MKANKFPWLSVDVSFATSNHKVKQLKFEGGVGHDPGYSWRLSSVSKVWDVVVGVSSATLRGVAGDPQMVKPRKKDENANDDEGNGTVGMLRTQHRSTVFLPVSQRSPQPLLLVCDLLIKFFSSKLIFLN